MNDKVFLKYAVTQAFRQPLITDKEIKIARSGTQSGFVFQNLNGLNVHPAYFSRTDFHKILRMAAHEITHSAKLMEEYDTFKHYLSENINVPTDNPQAQKLQTDFALTNLSRSAAQKKKIIATIIAGDFAYKFRQLRPTYNQIIQQLQKIEENNKAAVDCCQLSEFATAYRQIIKHFRFTNFAFGLNKKRFLSYLCEAIQILRFRPKLPDDYLETRRFIGEASLFLSASTQRCRNYLQYLLTILENMAQKDDLLQNAQKILAQPRNYRQIIQQYRMHRAPENLSFVNTLRQNTKKLFRQYSFLTYLDGVRLALEYKLDEIPEQHLPALPTVAPQEEIKKIQNLVKDSIHMSASGKLTKVYANALTQFAQTIRELQKDIAQQL